MTRLDRIIKGFNDYSKLVQELTSWLDDETEVMAAGYRADKIKDEVSNLIGELKRFGCRREK